MKNRYAIKEIDHLGLGYKSFINKDSDLKDGLEIYLWSEDFNHRWTIASFEFNEHEECFELHEVGDRLCNPSINYEDLKELITLGHDMLSEID